MLHADLTFFQQLFLPWLQCNGLDGLDAPKYPARWPGTIYFVYSSYECNVGELDKIGPNYVQTCLHSMNLQVQVYRLPIGSMGLVYLPTCTINLSEM